MNKEEHEEYHRRLFYVLSIMIFLFFGGSFFYNRIEGWRMLDAMYFSATTMTTVGYGDFSPKTDAGRLFTIFYLFASVGIAFYGLSLFAAHFVEVREDHWVQRLDNVSIKKHTKNFHDTVRKLFVWESKELVEHDKLKKNSSFSINRKTFIVQKSMIFEYKDSAMFCRNLYKSPFFLMR